jgi:hypothetical protein
MGGHEHGPFKADTKRPIYLLKPHFIPHFHILDKNTKIEIMLVRYFFSFELECVM